MTAKKYPGISCCRAWQAGDNRKASTTGGMLAQSGWDLVGGVEADDSGRPLFSGDVVRCDGADAS